MINPTKFLSCIMHIEPKRRQSMVSLTTSLALTLIGFLSTMYFAHSIEKDILGIYCLFLAYLGILNLTGDAGLGGAVVKRITEGKDQNEFFCAFIILRILLLTVSISALLLARPLIVDLDNHGMFFWLLAALVVGVFSSSISSGIYSLGKVGINQTCRLLNSMGCIIFQVVAVFFGFGAAGMAGGFVFGMIAGGIIGFRFLEFRLVRFRSYHVKSLLSFSLWIFLVSSGSVVFSYTDTILIGYFMKNADINVYRIAFQFAGVASLTTVAIGTVLYPNISNWSTRNKNHMIVPALAKGFTYSLLLAIPVFTGGLVQRNV